MNTSIFIRNRFVLALAGIGPLAANAQGPHIGLKGGLNLSNLYSSEVNDDKLRTGFNVGLMGRTNLDQPIGLQVELLYSTKGNESTYVGFFGLVDQTVHFNLNYLELPVLASFRFADQMLELQVGGYAGYLLSADATTSGDLGTDSEDLDIDNFNTMDAGLAVGFAVNAGPAQFGARYEYGLVELAKSDAAYLLLGSAKNSCFQVYIAVGMPGEGK